MLSRNEILRICGTDYKAITLRLLEEADLASLIPSRNTRIGIKPNLVSPTAASYGATTHPEVAAGIIEYLQEHGYRNIVIAEGSWVGDKTSESFDVCGYYELSEQYGVPLIDTQKERSHKADCAGMRLNICECVRDIDFLINVPVLKGHCQTKITCALKNMKGLIPNSEKRRFHSMGLHAPIAHLSAGIRQDFIVVDHICGDLDFEDGGNPVVRNCVMAARDPVLVDTFVCKLLRLDPNTVPYIPMAAALGVGSMGLANAAVRTIDLQESPAPSEVSAADIGESAGLPGSRKIVELQDAAWEVESCSACYGYLIPALQRLKEEGLFEELMKVLGKTEGESDVRTSEGSEGDVRTSAGGEGDVRTSAECEGDIRTSAESEGDAWTSAGSGGDVRTSAESESDVRTSGETEAPDSRGGRAAAENVAPQGGSEENGTRICIGQGWRGRTGKIGVGNCTSRFDFCVRGCPPTENEIYEALKEYINLRR